MPKVGDVIKGDEIGKSGSKFIYYACPDCGYPRWVQPVQVKRNKGRCTKCAGIALRGKPKPSIRGENNPAWRGGRTLMKTGYIRMPIYVDDPYFPMAMGDKREGSRNHYWITEHRYVMAKHLGRCLKKWEIVHHKNGDKTDNRIENLELLPSKTSKQTHMAFTLLQQENESLKDRISKLEARVTLLEAERVVEQLNTRSS